MLMRHKIDDGGCALWIFAGFVLGTLLAAGMWVIGALVWRLFFHTLMSI
jgi:hypothetical protein